MRNHSTLILTIMLAFAMAACKTGAVQLDKTNAKDEVPVLTNLSFRFNKALVPDSLLQQWDSTPFIQFEPAIRGRFRWEQPDKLVFSPAQPLAPATNYSFKLNKELLTYSRESSVKACDDCSFHTPDLQLVDQMVQWVAPENKPTLAQPQLDLYFNYPVQPSLIKEKLQLKAGEKALSFSITSAAADAHISVLINGSNWTDTDIEAKLELPSGLLPEGGSNATKKEISVPFLIPSPFNLMINDVIADHDGVTGTITIRSSQNISATKLSDYISVSPSVSLQFNQTDDGLELSSNDFDVNTSYTLNIRKGLKGVIGGTLKEDYAKPIAFGELEPGISFRQTKAVYLSASGSKNLEVQITNLPKVKVVISKIYEQNILASQRFGYSPGGYDDYYYESGSGSDFVMGDIIYEAEIDTKTLPKLGNSRLYTFNPDNVLSDFKGIYHIKISSPNDYWVSDARFISLTDIGLIAKKGNNSIVVFANSIKTAQSLSGVNIIAYGANNQVLGTGTTDKDGVATITYIKRDQNGFNPAMIIAKTDQDFNYLPFNTTSVNTSRFEIGGKSINVSGWDAFIYPERDIYRPGETIHYNTIIRDVNWKIPGTIPVTFKWLLPNGKELKTIRKTLNEQGAVEGSLTLDEAAITGTYTLELYTSTNVFLTSKTFSVEEFMPDRIKVNTKISSNSLAPGQSAKLDIEALNFFGPPAANRKYEWEVQVKPIRYSSKRFSSYDFGISNNQLSFDKIVEEGTTNEEGKASQTYAVPTEFANNGWLKASMYTTVFDETGRPVSRMTAADIYTQAAFLGIEDDGINYYALNRPIVFPVVAVNKQDQPVSVTAKIMVVKKEYKQVLVRADSYFRYESQKESKVLMEQNIAINGERSSFTYVPKQSGDYEIRLFLPGASTYVSKEFYSYGTWGISSSSFDVNPDGAIDISLDKESYKPGENMKAVFKTPFSGRMLVTVETDHLLEYKFVEVPENAVSVDLGVKEEYLPNVYITATLVKPHEQSSIPLTVAHGFQRVKVAADQRQQTVKIEAPASIRSKQTQRIVVKAAPGSEVTLAAVDNGILQVTDFSTPDAFTYFYAARALSVQSFDMYPLLFPELKARLSSTGGDGDLELSKRTNPMPAKRVKLVSYWSGIVKADGSGNASFDVPVPAFSGQIRLMAMAYKNESFGAASQPMTVADPLVISTGLPRFLSPKDSVSVPVTISNTTNQSITVTAQIQSTGPVAVVGAKQQQVSIPAQREANVLFTVVAQSLGLSDITISAQGGNVKVDETINIGVRPLSPLQSRTGAGVVNGGSAANIVLNPGDLLPANLKYKLVVSKNPALNLGKQLQYLAQYPYGCTEQTVSIAFPQLYLDDLWQQWKGAKYGNASGAAVQEAIRKLKLRQLYDGGFTLWDGEVDAHWWASVYGAHFLLEAQKAGFEVDKKMIDASLSYLNNRLKSRQLITYYYNQNQEKKIAPKEVAYSLYVLSLAGKPNVATMNYYKSNPQLLSLDSKYLLSAAYALAGDKEKFQQLLPNSFSGEISVAQSGGSFYSDVRDEGIALNALVEVMPNHPQVGLMAQHISQQLSSRVYYTTQECAFSFLALGKMARAANGTNISYDLRANGKALASNATGSLSFDNKELTGGGTVALTTRGNGKLYYFWQVEGVSASGNYKEEDQFIKVRRKFFDRYGKPIQGNQFKQNDLIIVQLTLEQAYNKTVEQIVITDLLPAGFEIENPRTKEIPGMDWIKDGATPTALDVRDDRILFFLDLFNTKQTYYYAVRAVSPGVYQLAPAAADAMYKGEYHSYNGAGSIRIVK